MRLDHVAYRVKDREKASKFFQDCFGYKFVGTYNLTFEDGSTTEFNMLAPPEERHPNVANWTYKALMNVQYTQESIKAEFHAPPEIAVSDGPPGSIVGDWVAETNGGNGGIHHIGYEVEDVAAVMKEWQEKGYCEWYSEEPLVDEEAGLVQVFSKPTELTGLIYELIKRGKDNKGFSVKNVKRLMESTRKE
jgi:catechol 2,3-dioxygenase-like lactoylglutathione lyase family enzyme